jgi:hypothetical protein
MNIGDEVICINTKYTLLQLDELYIIRNKYKRDGYVYLTVQSMVTDQIFAGYDITRFELKVNKSLVPKTELQYYQWLSGDRKW